jgi:hypothetical protein
MPAIDLSPDQVFLADALRFGDPFDVFVAATQLSSFMIRRMSDQESGAVSHL